MTRLRSAVRRFQARRTRIRSARREPIWSVACVCPGRWQLHLMCLPQWDLVLVTQEEILETVVNYLLTIAYKLVNMDLILPCVVVPILILIVVYNPNNKFPAAWRGVYFINPA